jgi:hypothetical protein
MFFKQAAKSFFHPIKGDSRFFRNAGNAAALHDFAFNKTESHVITALRTCQLVSYL